ncbi:hypothetical protein VN97_g13119, partial [Penicillium thymicola]
MAALTAGSTVACLDGRDHHHTHLRDVFDLDLNIYHPTETPTLEPPEKRGVGSSVFATINGQRVSWINEWSGQHSFESTEAEPTATPTSSAIPNSAATSEAEANSSISPTPTTSSNWAIYPSNGEYSIDGFGASTAS